MENKKIYINNDELYKAIGEIIICIILSCLFGYFGYKYCIDNNYNTAKGIVFGALFPFILWTLHDLFNFGFIGYVLLVIIWIVICEYIPFFIGIIALISIGVYCIRKIINAYNNRIITETVTVYENKGEIANKEKVQPSYYIKNYDTDLEKINTEFDEYEYYCERCDKRISEEEYIENCGLCEECDAEVYFGERYDGDDYDLYK